MTKSMFIPQQAGFTMSCQMNHAFTPSKSLKRPTEWLAFKKYWFFTLYLSTGLQTLFITLHSYQLPQYFQYSIKLIRLQLHWPPWKSVLKSGDRIITLYSLTTKAALSDKFHATGRALAVPSLFPIQGSSLQSWQLADTRFIDLFLPFQFTTALPTLPAKKGSLALSKWTSVQKSQLLPPYL